MLHRLAGLFKPAVPLLIEPYRQAEGAKTREILMSVLHTPKKRQPHPEELLKWVLDQLAVDIMQDPFPLLFPNDSS